MKKIFIAGSVAAGILLQAMFAAPAMAQTIYNYSGYAVPTSQYSSYQYQQYQYPNYQYQYPYNYNYNYQYGYQTNCYNGYTYNCYPYQNYNYQYYNYPPSITGVSGPTQLVAGQTGTWTVTVGNMYNNYYGYNYGGYLSYTVSWGDENINPYASAYSGAVNTGTLSHTYTRPGTYTAHFTVTNQWGQSASASVTVQVSAGCAYQYQYNPYTYNPYQYNPYGYNQYQYGYQNCYPYPYVY